MVFNDASLFVLIILGIWVTILTVVVLRMVSHYNRLVKGANGATLQQLISEILTKQELQVKDIKEIKGAIVWLQKDGTLHLQRLCIVRFNPFSDTGGSQSFTIAILDGKDNGIIMTSLFARTGNRWYIKHIKLGVSEDVELSKEEQSAIKKARPVGGA